MRVAGNAGLEVWLLVSAGGCMDGVSRCEGRARRLDLPRSFNLPALHDKRGMQLFEAQRAARTLVQLYLIGPHYPLIIESFGNGGFDDLEVGGNVEVAGGE